MLPDFRFVIGAVLAAAMLAVTALGLLTAARVTHQTKLGPFETSRNLVFDDSSDWNQFYDPDSARRFGELARKADTPGASTQPAAEVPAQPATDVPAQTTADAPTQPVAATEVAVEPPDHDRTSDGAPPIASPVSDVVTAPAAHLPPADLAAPAMVEPAPTQTPPEKQLEEAARPEANPSSADEPRETGALTPASTAVTSPPSQDEAPNLIVTDDPPAAAAPVANAPAGAIETDAAKIDVTKIDVAKIDHANTETPTQPTMLTVPLPVARPAAVVALPRDVTPPAKPRVPARTPAPKARVAAPTQQQFPQNQQNWQQQQNSAAAIRAAAICAAAIRAVPAGIAAKYERFVRAAPPALGFVIRRVDAVARSTPSVGRISVSVIRRQSTRRGSGLRRPKRVHGRP